MVSRLTPGSTLRRHDGSLAAASLEGLPRDPWGNEYVYRIVDGAPQVLCLGSDGAEGGEGEAADVVRGAAAVPGPPR
ncbi:MAG: type II secretion system protein GspG [Planctomycetes bacterium]|nr:type II secretion system protein GspG [Planctomycetota bacterium]